MRYIQKKREPAALTNYRSSPGAKYDGDNGFPVVKEAIRQALVAEQRGLCGFCEMRVQASASRMRIAHRTPQSVDPSQDLNWRNLLAACLGNEGNTPTHCDVAQHNTPLQLDPTQAQHCATLRFERARLVSSNPVFAHEIDSVLQLNSKLLCDRREEALDKYISAWFAGRSSVPRTVLERMKAALDTPGELPAYVSYLQSWLNRHIRAR